MSEVMDRLRQMLRGNHAEMTARLEREVEELRRTLHDPAVLRALVVEALQEEIAADPSAVATVLTPALDELMRQRAAATPRATARPWSWLPVLIVITGVGAALMNWRGHGSMVSAATEQAPAALTAHAVVPVVEQHDDGFGLGRATRSDAEIVRDVRARLAGCPELIGASVSFSVKDGWVWLRGEASAGGRDAATHALADLGQGVFMVNQLVVSEANAALH